jgi:hypothetical protein
LVSITTELLALPFLQFVFPILLIPSSYAFLCPALLSRAQKKQQAIPCLTGARTTPVNAPPNHTKNRQKLSFSKSHKKVNNSDILFVIADLESQEVYIY